MDADIHKVMIIGSGPAGLTAAIYAGRAQNSPIVIEGPEPGGQLFSTTDIENFPGFPEGTRGPELMEKMRAQAVRFGARIVRGSVGKVDFVERPFRVWTADGELRRAHSVIIATGSSYKWLGLASEQSLRGHGVSACAVCDGPFFRGRPVVVVGGGDSALEEALFLHRLGSQVTIVHRRAQFRASKIMSDRVVDNPEIRIKWNCVVEEVFGDVGTTGVTGVRVRDVATGQEETLPCSGVFVAIGRNPNTSIFQGILDIDKNGYLVTEPGTTRTSVEGIFACGEVQDNTYRQAVTSAGSGAMAAMDARHWLEICGIF
ncbi:MAG: thioredoxin-disulfide reductase [Nitrospirae bacterium]|nr:thioredoxin-disulfide reductase [Nitrospirota bacterium]